MNGTTTAQSPLAIEEVQQQAELFPLSGKNISADFYDAKDPIFVPSHILAFKTHKLEVMVQNLERQSVKNPAQFNSKSYMEIVNELMKCYEQIKEEADEQISHSGAVANPGNQSPAGAMGQGSTPSMGNGVSSDNPAAG